MTPKEKLDRLYQISRSSPDPTTREEAFQRWHRLSRTAETGQRPENHAPNIDDRNPSGMRAGQKLAPIQEAERRFDSPIRRAQAGSDAYGANEVVGEGIRRFTNGATAGISDGAMDLVDQATGDAGASRAARARFQGDSPVISNALTAAGGFAPGGIPAKLGGAVERGVVSAVSSLSPKLQALIGPALRRLAGGAAAGATVGATQGALGADDGDRLASAGRGATLGAFLGGGMAGASAVAGKVAGALRNEDVALLEKYGLRPSMVPGTPVTAEGTGVLENMRNPPLGTHTAGPESRQAAGIKGAQEILADLVARKNANSSQIAAERAGNELPGLVSQGSDFIETQPVGRRPMSYNRAIAEASALSGQPGTLPNVRSAIGTVEGELTRSAGRGSSALPAGDLQKIASMSHDLASPDAYGGPDKPVLRLLGGKLHSQLPPEMLDQDARYATAASNLERARESLGMERGDIENPQGEPPLAAIKKAGNTIGRVGEGTKAAANADLGVSRLREEGPPDVMTGPGGAPSQFAPRQIGYAPRLDLPALHVAQENLQLNPSAVFSGGGSHGLIHRLGGAGARRFLYPPLRGAGSMDTTRGVAPALTLLDALRLQLKQDELSGNEGE